MKITLYFLLAVILVTGCKHQSDLNDYVSVRDADDISLTLKYIDNAVSDHDKAKGYYLAGYQYKKKKAYNEAYAKFKIAYKYFLATSNEEWQAKSLQIIGNILRENNSFNEALEYYNKAITTYPELEYKMTVDIWKSKCYWALKEGSSALPLLIETSKYWKDKNDFYYGESMLILGNIQFAHAKQTNNLSYIDEKAFGSYMAAYEALKGTDFQVDAVNNLGNCYLLIGKHDRAKLLLDSALRMYKSEERKSPTYLLLARMYKEIGKLDSAVLYHGKSIKVNQSWSYEFQHSYKELIDIYFQSGDYTKGNAITHEFLDKNEQMAKEANKIRQQSSTHQFELLNLQLEHHYKMQQAQKESFIHWIAICILIVCVLVIVVVARYYSLKKSNRIKEIIGSI